MTRIKPKYKVKFDPSEVIVPKGLSLSLGKSEYFREVSFWLLLKRKSKFSNFKGWRKAKRVELCQTMGVSYSLFCLHVRKLKELGLAWEDEYGTLYLLSMHKAKKVFKDLGLSIADRKVWHENFEGDYKSFKKYIQALGTSEYLKRCQFGSAIRNNGQGTKSKKASKFALREANSGSNWTSIATSSIARAMGKKSASTGSSLVKRTVEMKMAEVQRIKPLYFGTHHKAEIENESFSFQHFFHQNFEKNAQSLYKELLQERVSIIYTKKGVYGVFKNRFKSLR